MNRASVIAWSLLAGSVFAAEPAFDTLIAHRGESVDAPENTLPAYRMAVERGFGFECDVYLSSDGLAFQLDGIRNVGADRPHDNAATAWADLAGGNGATFGYADGGVSYMGCGKEGGFDTMSARTIVGNRGLCAAWAVWTEKEYR